MGRPRALILAATACLAVSSSPQPRSGAWVTETMLLERVERGSRTLLIANCSGIEKGSRVRLSFAGEEEEEGSVAALSCPSPGLSRFPAAARADAEPPCDLAALGWKSPDGLDGEAADAFRLPSSGGAVVPARCQQLLPAAQRVPGIAESSYQAAQRTAKLSTGGGNALLPAAGPEGAEVQQQRPVPGVLTLAAETLFAHAAKASVRASSALNGRIDAAGCAVNKAGAVCSGAAYGKCDVAAGRCVCSAGFGGAACDQATNRDAVPAHAVREKAVCPSGCGGHGDCLSAGVCGCHTGWHGESCTVHSAAACADSCGGSSRGTCALSGSSPICLCKARFFGATCLLEMNDCPNSCNNNGQCSLGVCSCYQGYSGSDCSEFCPFNCTLNSLTGSYQGRCDINFKCRCKAGYSGPACDVECLGRCFGNGECVDGVCACYEGYEGSDCSRLSPTTFGSVLLGGFQGYYPVVLICLFGFIGCICFCGLGYILNRAAGRVGTAAVPMWDYYAKRWRNAPLFEPIFAVSATTQTPPARPVAKAPPRASYP
uniref:EGF-like domain-containing protein n=1 Tax=Haptolina brevifila TaxID=156173 RepID=A0A7S2BFZ6_9EUKA